MNGAGYLDDLAAFAIVAQERSFTRAAVRLGVAQPSLSQAIRSLEERLGFRLLTRTTRSVAPTEAGERLLRTIGPRFEEIAAELAVLRELRDQPSGNIRITTAEHAAVTILQPAIAKLLPRYPDIRVEISVDHALKDIVAARFDAGIRLGEQVAKDMIAIRIGPDIRMAVVGSPSYFERHPSPVSPQELLGHSCITMRLPTYDEVLPWEFGKNGREMKVRVDGQLVFNAISLRLAAVLDGLGLAYLPEDQVAEPMAEGRLLRVLDDWCPAFSGYHLYYPSRRHTSSAFTLLLDALRFRG